MTGPALGKIKIQNAKVYILEAAKMYELDGAEVYIHLKGFSYARVTHLDIEHEKLNNIIRKDGGYFKIKGIPYGLVIHLTRDKRIVVRHKVINDILMDSEDTFTWVGSKPDGIYIGFKKKHILKLEKLASKLSKK